MLQINAEHLFQPLLGRLRRHVLQHPAAEQRLDQRLVEGGRGGVGRKGVAGGLRRDGVYGK